MSEKLFNGDEGLYVHFPFCRQKCRYCAFYSVPGTPDELRADIDAYIDALGYEMQEFSERNPDFMPKTIYIGGGTPSLMNSRQFENLYLALDVNFTLDHVKEFTFEVNPGMMPSDAMLDMMQKKGVTRLSVGTQSFVDSELQWMGRIHNAKESIEAIDTAQLFQFGLSCDLIYSLPGQNEDDIKRSLDILIDKKVKHISAYTLIIEKGTPVGDELLNSNIPNDDEREGELFDFVSEYLRKNGYDHYEVSSFALIENDENGKPIDNRAMHNLNYWRHGNYAGFGASAYGHFPGYHTRNCADYKQYTMQLDAGTLPTATERLTLHQTVEEIVMVGLRSSEGIDTDIISRKYGINPMLGANGLFFDQLIEDGYAKRDNKRYYLTPNGFAICDFILRKLEF